MKPKFHTRGFYYSQNACSAPARSLIRSQRRHATTSTKPSTPSSSPARRPWLRLAFITLTATGVGVYVRWSQDSASSSTTLGPARFTPYCLVSREPISSTGSLFILKPPKSDGSNLGVYEDAWKTGVWSVMFKQPQLQIGRDYTPLPPVSSNEDDANECLRFFIRKDPFGEVSRYLHSLKIGAPIDVRGPRIECEIPSETETILFIAGGTGIAPALQAGHTLLRRTDDINRPKIHILWATRQREDCRGGYNDHMSAASGNGRWSWLSQFFNRSKHTAAAPPGIEVDVGTSAIVKDLEAFKAQYPGQVTVEYFVDEESTFIGKKSILDFTDSATSSPEQCKRNMILVSGPEGFISYMAGPKQWAQGMELQGPLLGLIKELNLHGWSVWKL
ncbi:hypothetical protein BJY01DRAFT_243238 [Aspergillus pseudoustus]|uniref:FAD-binding FR-type domain-containing protein n=1 Tax=Aspergillus pseudoustus TaxID=1810923 RepID=A0ABR4KTA0_9EURO